MAAPLGRYGPGEECHGEAKLSELDLRRLLRHARSNVNAPPPSDLRARSVYVHRHESSFLIEGGGVVLLRRLQRELAGSSRLKAGMSLEEAEALLLEACEDAVDGIISAAVARLMVKVGSPLTMWTVAEAIDLFHIPTERLNVGRTIYATHIPRTVVPAKALDFAGTLGFAAPVALVKVKARDGETARVLAAERFAESAAILDLLDRPKLNAGRTTVARNEDGTGGTTQRRGGWLINDGYVDDRGWLVPPFRQLSRAAARDEGDRSDWERRTLAATRWYSRACRSAWPADRLASLMVALECLFVAGRSESTKGAHIATRLTERFRLREMSEADQRDWLAHLYRARNDAVHEGRDVVDDLDVDRLMDVTQAVIRYLAAHLVPAHRPRGRSCRTFDEVMRCSAP